MSHTLWYIIGGAVVVLAFVALQWYYNQSTPRPAANTAAESGEIVKQFKLDGDSVAIGDKLVEIEYDGCLFAIDSKYAGIIEWLVPAGQTAEIGSTIANISDGVDDNAVVLSQTLLVQPVRA